jgi:Glycosyltransferase 61
MKINSFQKDRVATGLLWKVRELAKSSLIKFTSLNNIAKPDAHKVGIPLESIPTPEIMTFPPLTRFPKLQSGVYTNPNVCTTILNDVLYCPDHEIILTPSRSIILESVLYGSELINEFDLKKIFCRDVEFIPGWCSVFRNRHTYAHSLLDNIPRCYLLDNPEYRGLEEIKLLCSSPFTEIENLFVPKLVPKNAKPYPVSKGKLYHIENLIFPAFLRMAGSGYLPLPYLSKIRSEFLSKRPCKKNKRIYISREAFALTSKRHILNEEELFSALNKVGFEKYMTEKMSIPEQIELFSNAEIVVAVHGAALSNILFSREIDVLELHPTKSEFLPFFYHLSKSLGHRHKVWFGNEIDFYSNFEVNVSEILALLPTL